MGLINVLFGRPLASSEDEGQRITPTQGIPTFGLDALSSAAYGPEAALTILLPLGLLGVRYIVPLTFAVIALLIIVYFSYRQTIAAYPMGGGSYTVAKENLGNGAGVLAGGALMIDYLLNVAVGISAGIGALVSAIPSLQPHTLAMCLAVLAILTFVNLRGVEEAGSAFVIPTYLFVGTLTVVIVIGLYKVVVTGGHPIPITAPPRPVPVALQAVGLWILVKAFASGCPRPTGRESRKQGRAGFSKAGGSSRESHFNCHHRDSGRIARRNCRAAEVLRHHGHRSRSSGISRCSLDVDRRRSGQRDLLQDHHVLGLAGAVPFSQHLLC